MSGATKTVENPDAPTRGHLILWQTIPVRAADMDARRHVNNANYLTFFEIVRRQFFESHDVYAQFETKGQNPVLVSQTCVYRKPLSYPATIDIGMALEDTRTRSFTFRYGIFLHESEELAAHGLTAHAWFDHDRERAVTIPNEIRATLAQLSRP